MFLFLHPCNWDTRGYTKNGCRNKKFFEDAMDVYGVEYELNVFINRDDLSSFVDIDSIPSPEYETYKRYPLTYIQFDFPTQNLKENIRFLLLLLYSIRSYYTIMLDSFYMYIYHNGKYRFTTEFKRKYYQVIYYT